MKLFRILSLIVIGCLSQGLYAAEERSATINLPDLPSELIAQIAQNLSLPDLARFIQTSRRMHAICEWLKIQSILKEKFIRDLWRLGKIKHELVATNVSSFAISSDSSFIAMRHEDGSVTIINARTGEVIKRLKTGNRVCGLAISRDSSFIAMRHQYGSVNVNIIDARTGKVMNRLETGSSVYDLAISRDSSFIATRHEDGSVSIIDARTGKVMNRLETGSSVYVIAISPDRSFMVTGHSDGTVLRNLETDREWKLGYVCQLAISSDSSFIVTENRDNYIRIWNSATGELIREWKGGSLVWYPEISPDGSFIVTHYDDGSMRIWRPVIGHTDDAAGIWYTAGECLRRLFQHLWFY